ncbi:TonB C-terminal domain-containing protein [Helicobacter pametensis]|uniref:TonB C-terminal domain-containing protein n=1 Tax=Helicobacter pametensis TaxID=95149 RepID=UPI000483E1D8|nr:TonB C-terminal domain-containing protein [Helicobacter pametensis]
MNKRIFLSGVLALTIECALLALIFVALIPKIQKQYTFKEKTALEFIQIEEVLDKKPQTPKESKVKDQKPKQEKPKPKEMPAKQKASPAPSPKVGTDIRKLFEKIDSSNPPVREERIEDDRPLFSANVIKKKEYSFDQNNSQIKEESSKIQSAFDSLWENELEVTTPQRQDISDGEYDEWFAKIKEILYAKWTNSFYKSVSLTVSITIESDGRLHYRILRYSNNRSYNAYMKNLLDELMNEEFPPYPKGRITLEVIFKTKEHENG